MFLDQRVCYSSFAISQHVSIFLSVETLLVFTVVVVPVSVNTLYMNY